MKPARIGLVGVGGFGNSYRRSIATMEEEGLGTTGSVVIRNEAKYPEQVAEYREKGVPIRSSMTEMIEKDGENLDLLAIPTGINTHHTLLIEAADAGFNTILEKPPTSTIQYMDAMQDALERNNTWCQIGFNSQGLEDTVRPLKRLICEGKLGRIKEAVVRGVWVRPDSYFERNPWAGQFKDGDVYVLDGTINNPLAHQLMNALYFTCEEWGKISRPARVRAELYKGHRIESEDTSAVEVELASGGKVYFFASLCGEADSDNDIYIEIVGDKGRALWTRSAGATVELDDGTTETFEPDINMHIGRVFRNAIRYLRGEDKELDCPLEMTRNFVLAVNGAFMSSGTTRKIPDDMLNIYDHENKEKGTVERRTEIPDISRIIKRCFDERKLYSDLGLPWATPTKPFELEGFTRFEMDTPALDQR